VNAVERFLVPAVPLARVAWLRHVIYPFVLLDVLWIVTDPIPHGDVPPSLYRGLAVRDLLHLPAPSHTYVRVLLGVVVVSTLVAATGRLPRLAGWVCAVGMLDWVSNAFAYSKVDHDHFALVLALFVLPTAGRARVADVDVRSQAAGWAVRMVQVGAVCIYWLSASAKMRFGGWGWANGATLIWALSRRGHGPGPWLASHPPLTHAMQWVVLVVEFCSPLMLWLRGRALAAYVLFWCCFHASTWVLLKIHFLPLAVCLLAFAPLERLGTPTSWPDRARARAAGLSRAARPRRGDDARPPAASAAPSSGR
jgi:hypothetical protein